MPSKKRKFNARFPAGRIKKIMRIDDDIGKVALPVPVMISRALELFVSSLLVKAGDITMQKNARTLTLPHLKQCINSDDRLDFLKDHLKDIPEVAEESNDTNRTDSPVNKKRRVTNNDDSDEEVFSLNRYNNNGDEDNDKHDVNDKNYNNDENYNDNDDYSYDDHNDERLNTAAVQKAIQLSLFVEDGDSGDAMHETMESSMLMEEGTSAKVVQEMIESPLFLGEGTSAMAVQETFKIPFIMKQRTRSMAMQKTIKSPVIIKQETSTEAVQETIDSALSKKENAELETLQEAIQSHMNSSCECWGATPANVEDIFRRFGRTFPPETQDVDAIAEYLSTVRMLLSKNRLQVIASRCPEMTNACSALIANKKWRQKILAILSSTDDYLRYKAVCATSEILLHFTYDRDGTPAQLYKNIIQLILSDNSRLARAAALQTLTLVLQTNDHDNLTPYTKSMMLHHVQKYWKSVVNKVTCYKDKSLVELLALWNAVFVALKEPKVIQSVDEDLVHSYLLGLSRIESLLHAEDSQPLVWLKTIRLLGSAMFARTTAHCNTLLILSHTVLIGFHSSKLLESFHKMKDGFMWPDNQILGLQDIMLLVMRSLRVYVKKCESRTKAVAMVMYTVERLDLYVKSSRMYETDVSFSKWLVRLMYDRDDALIECLTIAIDIMRKLSVTRMLLDPFQSFVELTERGSYDPDLFLDHLISDETDFLCYFMKLLKIIVRFSQRFFRCCGDKLTKTMDLLYRLRRKMRRSRFPYKIEPAAKLIDKCQKLHKSFLLPSNPLIIDY